MIFLLIAYLIALAGAAPLSSVPATPTSNGGFGDYIASGLNLQPTSSAACAIVSSAWEASPLTRVPVDAQTAYDCLTSVPVNTEGDIAFIDQLKLYLDFQSSLT